MNARERQKHLDRIAARAILRAKSEEQFVQAVIAAWDEGVPIRQIAEAAGYKSHGTLYQLVKRSDGNRR